MVIVNRIEIMVQYFSKKKICINQPDSTRGIPTATGFETLFV